MYQHGEHEAVQRNKPKRWDSRRYALLRLKSAIEATFIRVVEAYPKAVLLDFGCGSMPYREQFSPKLEKYIGADLKLNPNANVHIGENNELPLDVESVNIVLSTQVLEHVEDPQKYLAECFRVLKKGGRLIISTHGYWMYHPDPNDYWRWTSAGLKKIIEKENFHVETVQGVLGRSAVGLQLFQDGMIFKLPKLVNVPFVIIMQLLISFFDKLTRESTKSEDAGIFVITAIKN